MGEDDMQTLRSGLTIMPQFDRQINQMMGDLLSKIPARFLVLVDVTGQVVAAKGDHDDTNLVMLGSLVAGDLAASQEIARLTQEYQDYQIVLREGQRSNTFICEAGNYLALLVQVGNDVPLGWARMLIKQTVRELADAAAEAAAESRAAPRLEMESESDDEPGELDDLSDLFGDALDEMWME